MTAVPIYVWNGSAWQETGPTIPASPIKYQASAPSSPSTGDIWVDSDGDVTTGSQQFQRFRFVASGGETTISGADANGAVLAYTAGLEQVVLNGAVLVRGHDYTATNGTSITGLSPALVANDVLEVFSFIAFTVANTYTQSQVDGLITDAVGMKLIVPTSAVNGTVGATGAVTFSGASSISINDVFSSTYENYRIVLNVLSSVGETDAKFRMRASGSDDSSSNYEYCVQSYGSSSSSYNIASLGNQTSGILGRFGTESQSIMSVDVGRPNIAARTHLISVNSANGTTTYFSERGAAVHRVTTAYTGITFFPASGTITGTIRVYGYKN